MSTPAWKSTYKFIKRLAEFVTFGTIAGIAGKNISVAEAWGRPFPSHEHPGGTGKKDVSQTVLRLIGLAHEHDAGLAREWAETFKDYVDYLDNEKGRQGSVCELVGQNAKEQMDIVVSYLHSENPDMGRVLSEAIQAKAKLNQLIACLKTEAK